MHLRSIATLSILLVLSLATPAAASPPASDRQRDAVGDVVRTYADGHVSMGRGRSDIRAVRMHSIDISGVGRAVDVVVRLTEVDRHMFQNHVHLKVRFTAATGHVGRTVSDFTSRGTRTRMEGFRGDDCVPYPRRGGAHDRIAISLPRDCWPVAKSVRARVLVRYDVTSQGRAYDSGRVGPIAIPR
jgi:hypothetical protein